MKKNILRIHFNGDVPNIAEMTEVLSNAGFRPLTDATPDTLPSGSVVVIYNSRNHALSPLYVVEQHLRGGFSYMLFNELNSYPDMEYMDTNHDFSGKFYKLLFQLPVVDSQPQLEYLNNAIEKAGFRSLDTATPDDLPMGSIALLYTDCGILTPVITRTLSMSNKRFLYLHQGMAAGHWHSSVIMDHLKPFKNYSYLVIS